MPHSDRFERNHLIVDADGDSSSLNVGALLEHAAERIRLHGQLTVHHLVFESDPDAHDPTMSLTVYYDRIRGAPPAVSGRISRAS